VGGVSADNSIQEPVHGGHCTPLIWTFNIGTRRWKPVATARKERLVDRQPGVIARGIPDHLAAPIGGVGGMTRAG
jgi:hypothetical protein